MTTELAEAVEALTKPSRTKVIRDDGSTIVVEHEPLLVQLETAVTSAIGNGGGGGTATGSVINDAALYQLLLIKTQIGDWCRLAGVRPDRQNTTVTLERWFVAQDGSSVFHTRTLEQWADTITDLLDPPKTVPLDGPCPVCKATSWEDGTGDTRTIRASPVAVLYDQATLHASLRAVCRVVECSAEWSGADAVQELIEEMSEGDSESAILGQEADRG